MTQWVKVAELQQISAGQKKLVKVKNKEIALFKVKDTLYAIDNRCPHSTGPLIEGRLFGTVITCPWHGSQFDLASGACQSGPASKNVSVYAVHLEAGAIFIEIS